MAEMTAKVRKICVIEDREGRCGQSTETDRGCPLWEFCCGVPNNKSEINAAIETVKNYKIVDADTCPKCGREEEQ